MGSHYVSLLVSYCLRTCLSPILFFVVKVILQVLLTRHSCEMSTVVALNLGETPCCSNVYAEGGEIGASQKCRGEHVVGLTEMFARLVI